MTLIESHRAVNWSLVFTTAMSIHFDLWLVFESFREICLDNLDPKHCALVPMLLRAQFLGESFRIWGFWGVCCRLGLREEGSVAWCMVDVFRALARELDWTSVTLFSWTTPTSPDLAYERNYVDVTRFKMYLCLLKDWVSLKVTSSQRLFWIMLTMTRR